MELLRKMKVKEPSNLHFSLIETTVILRYFQSCKYRKFAVLSTNETTVIFTFHSVNVKTTTLKSSKRSVTRHAWTVGHRLKAAVSPTMHNVTKKFFKKREV